jgi:hypothetical protein
MSNNLFISYDLNSPGQDYSAVINKIQSLGVWAKVQKSHFYVSSNLTAEQARDKVWSVMDNNDTLIVIDTSNNDAAWQNLLPEVSKQIKDNWAK